jgi:hypothetical protein
MKSKAHSIIGASNNCGGRVLLDHYPTPLPAVEKLMEREAFVGTVWEPACGEGNISKVLINHGYKVYSSDIFDYGFGRLHDFLNPPKEVNDTLVDNVITNPPFNRALEFVNKSKRYSRDKIAFLLKTQFLEGVERYSMYQDKEFPLKKIYQFARRVTFQTSDSKNGGMIAFAWFIWERGYKGTPQIDWII